MTSAWVSSLAATSSSLFSVSETAADRSGIVTSDFAMVGISTRLENPQANILPHLITEIVSKYYNSSIDKGLKQNYGTCNENCSNITTRKVSGVQLVML